jgi:hypothetical protein
MASNHCNLLRGTPHAGNDPAQDINWIFMAAAVCPFFSLQP